MPMSIQEMSDRLEITELTGAWTDAVNWRDIDRFRGMWTEDAIWTISDPIPMRADGIDAIVEKLRQLLDLETAFFEAMHTGTMQIDGDVARAKWGVSEFGKPKTEGPGYFNHAVYRDELRRTERGSRFSRRDYLYVYVDRAMLRGDWVSLALPAK